MPPKRLQGTVEWFNDRKGYGFIKRNAGGNDVFVHYSGIASDAKHRTLLAGQVVEFDLAQHEGKTLASNVKVVQP